MGRKAAPQPLALPSQSSPQAQTQSQFGSDAALRSRDDPPNAETVSPAVSPVESKSPRSPRSSPFHSRFSPLRNQSGKHKKVSHTTAPTATATADEKSSSLTSTPTSATVPVLAPPPPTTITAQRPSTSTTSAEWDRQRSAPRLPLRQTREDPTSYPSISSTLEEKLPSPLATTTTTAQPEAVQPSTNDVKKGTKNGFFHFNKHSKSSNQSQPHAQHRNQTEARAQVMSRGSDGPNRPRHGGM
jgi:hypothetical protein